MRFTKLLLSALLLLVGITACYDDYTHDYEGADMGFAVAKPLRTVISDRDMNIYIGVAIGGKREIDMNDWAKFTIDPSLLEGTGKCCYLPITIRWRIRNISGCVNRTLR